MKLIRVRDLRYGDNGSGKPMLYCIECGGEYSADAGDYFMARPDTVMKCCDQPMLRVVKQTRYQTA
jgi:hypothetical protein